MARQFGLFEINKVRPSNHFEGDDMEQNGEYVQIFDLDAAANKKTQVAAIRLDKGQFVKEITGTDLARPAGV